MSCTDPSHPDVEVRRGRGSDRRRRALSSLPAGRLWRCWGRGAGETAWYLRVKSAACCDRCRGGSRTAAFLTFLLSPVYSGLRSMTKRRVDTLLVERGLVESRRRGRPYWPAVSWWASLVVSRALIDEAGGPRLLERQPFVSRGGEAGMRWLRWTWVAGRQWTWGFHRRFPNCLLRHGPSVYAVDVNWPLDYRLRQDARVVS
jgi:hypothetical protein